jgi:hypothetical protein
LLGDVVPRRDVCGRRAGVERRIHKKVELLALTNAWTGSPPASGWWPWSLALAVSAAFDDDWDDDTEAAAVF